MLEPGGDSFAVVTRLTGTTQGSPTQSEGNAVHEAEQGEDTQQGQTQHMVSAHRNDRHESWAGLVLIWAGLVPNIDTVAKRQCMCCRPSDWLDCIISILAPAGKLFLKAIA